MALELEIREKHKNVLGILLDIKKANEGVVVKELQESINRQVRLMDQEDVAIIEKIVGIKAL